MERHFTVTGFVIDGDRSLLHWHKKLGLWLPPGGHIDANEDPVQAVLRELLEETGMTCEVVRSTPAWAYGNVSQLPPPLSIIVADVAEGPHQHIDMCYAVRRVAGIADVPAERDHGFVWVTEAELRRNDPLPVASCGVDIAVPDDVRELSLAAIALVRSAGPR